MSTDTPVLNPLVKWGQTDSHVYLTVLVEPSDVSSGNTENPLVKIEPEQLSVRIFGDGANGRNLYGFDFHLYLSVHPVASKWNPVNHGIEIILKKEYKDPWPRLTFKRQRLPWAKFDFDRFQFDDSDISVDDTANGKKDLDMSDISGVQIEHRTRKKRNQTITEEDPLLKLLMNPLTLYLLLYNLVQFAGFLYIFSASMYLGYTYGLDEAYQRVYEMVIDQLAFVQILTVLEVFHVCLGWVNGSVGTTFMQVFGRNLALKLIVSHPHLHQVSTFYWLVVAWSSIEIVRYPFYLLATLQEELGLITYLRYTLWIPLYPLGFICEGKMILGALSAIEDNDTYSIALPNKWNFSLHVPTFLKLYLLFMLGGFYMLMLHMYKRRKAKIGPNPKSTGSSWSFLEYMLSRNNTRALPNQGGKRRTAGALRNGSGSARMSRPRLTTSPKKDQ